MKAEKEHEKSAAVLLTKLWPGNTEEEMLECATEYIGEAEKAAFLAREEGAFCGICLASLRHDYVEGTEESPVGYLEGIYVDENRRGQGMARALLSAAQAWAKDMGCREFASDCELTNTQSIAFHKSVGFSEENRIVCFKKEL